MGLKITAALLGLLIILSGVFYWYYQDSQATIQTLYQNNARLETAVEENEKTIDSLEQSYNQSKQELRRVNEEFAQIRRQNTVLAEKLEEHDLGVLGNAKPELVQRIVNSATDDANRCFELLSGAPLTEEERNAETPKKANSECPWLFDSGTSG
jgi:predicted nuclease with TOPRIM domain